MEELFRQRRKAKINVLFDTFGLILSPFVIFSYGMLIGGIVFLIAIAGIIGSAMKMRDIRAELERRAQEEHKIKKQQELQKIQARFQRHIRARKKIDRISERKDDIRS